jgi:hypothetical protein
MDENAVDDLIEEIREIRRGISARFGDDVHRYGDYLRKIQHEFPNRVVTREELDSREKKPAA